MDKYGNFEYRVVHDKMRGYYVLQLFEVNGVYYFISKEPTDFCETSFERLKLKCNTISKLFDKPIIEYENIKEMHDMPPKLCK